MMSRSIRRTGRLLATFAPLLAHAACGNLVAGGATGEAIVILSGDADDFASTVSIVTPATAQRAPSAVDGSGGPEGEIEVAFKLFLEASDGDLIALTEEEVRVRVDLEGVREEEVANRLLPVGTYTGMRIVFTEIEVEVDAGLIINGVAVTGPIEVEWEDITLPVTVTLPFEVRANKGVVLLIDLNAASWLEAVDPVTATVDAQVFADLVTVVVR